MRKTLLQYFPNLTDEQLLGFEKLSELFPIYNSKVNCISRKDINNFFEHHILHSLSIALFFNFDKGTRILDIGTGGGFPGLPLAIMYPQLHFDLVDSISKKIAIVNELVIELQLNNVKTLNTRAENISTKYDIIVSRAVSSFPVFEKIANPLLNKQSTKTFKGIIYLKGGDFAQEIKDFKNIKVFNIKDFYNMEFFETKKIIYFQTS